MSDGKADACGDHVGYQQCQRGGLDAELALILGKAVHATDKNGGDWRSGQSSEQTIECGPSCV